MALLSVVMPCAMDQNMPEVAKRLLSPARCERLQPRQCFADFRYAFKFCSPTRCAIQSGESCTPTYVPQKTANCGNTDRRCELHSARKSLSGERIPSSVARVQHTRRSHTCPAYPARTHSIAGGTGYGGQGHHVLQHASA